MEIEVLKNEKDSIEFEADCDPGILELITTRLNKNEDVEFAACKIEHPLTGRPKAIVRMKKGNALDAVLEIINDLEKEVSEFKKNFQKGK